MTKQLITFTHLKWGAVIPHESLTLLTICRMLPPYLTSVISKNMVNYHKKINWIIIETLVYSKCLDYHIARLGRFLPFFFQCLLSILEVFFKRLFQLSDQSDKRRRGNWIEIDLALNSKCKKNNGINTNSWKGERDKSLFTARLSFSAVSFSATFYFTDGTAFMTLPQSHF